MDALACLSSHHAVLWTELTSQRRGPKKKVTAALDATVYKELEEVRALPICSRGGWYE